WKHNVLLLRYKNQGKLRDKGVGIRAVLSIAQKKIRRIRDDLKKISGYYHIPEEDLMQHMNDKFRGWCNYYRYANSPQPVFNRLAYFTWWRYAHFNARKHKKSIKAMIKIEQKAKKLGKVKKNGRERNTFQIKL